ncbi:LOW QUALITY PROTEIN: vomeronasal type-2 receptor 116-like [Phodopus roborovskii]|uniref:LOW QUALITY PROTEIN: vomeronasal type-2 receptor 116-like n=1 Tax=Phodopus roborovskii TaxID=109678 RepID=UPI0021E4FECD|nr:LOW QUALITY PROTEIN: vomeronasal type-2 receptor 116-like [Phodopus roborovskii]
MCDVISSKLLPDIFDPPEAFRYRTRSYQYFLAFIFAIEEINRNTHILPNTSLGFDLYNINSNQWDTLEAPFICLTGMGTMIPNYTCRRQKKAAALLTGISWATSAHIGRLLNLYKYPQATPEYFYHLFDSQLPRSVCSESCFPGFRKSPRRGRPACCYDCTQCPDNEISNETDTEHCMRCPESHYANTEQNHCLQKTVTFLAYEDTLGLTLASLALGFSTISVGVLCVFVKHHHTPIVKANNWSLTYILLITLTFCFLCPLLFIGHPNTVTCVLQQSTFAVLFTVALSTVLAKTITVVLAFKATVPGRLIRWIMISRAPNYIIPVCTLIQLVLCGIWLSISPPFVDSDAHTEHGHIIASCNKGSTIAFHSVLGYLCSLALGSYTMAYLSRNLPDTFNEAKFISFSMLVFFSVWVTFLPVYHSTKGKVTVAMEGFSILSSSAGLLGCIFVPKCYIILFRPHRNVLNYVRNKAPARGKVDYTV